MSIVRAISPEIPEPAPGTWSNCLVAGGVAYVAGMTASGGDLAIPITVFYTYRQQRDASTSD